MQMWKRLMNLHQFHSVVEKDLKRKKVSEEAEKDLIEH